MRQAPGRVLMTNAECLDLASHLRTSPQSTAQQVEDSTISQQHYKISAVSWAFTSRYTYQEHTPARSIHLPQRPYHSQNHNHHTRNANRNPGAPALSHPPDLPHLPNRRLLRNMVSALQANRTHLCPTIHPTFRAGQIRFRENQRRRAAGTRWNVWGHGYADFPGVQGREKSTGGQGGGC
jgi:hypothetical protein